jgi:hypothetical protein
MAKPINEGTKMKIRVFLRAGDDATYVNHNIRISFDGPLHRFILSNDRGVIAVYDVVDVHRIEANFPEVSYDE